MAFEDPEHPVKDILPDKRTDFTFRGKTILLMKQRGAPKKGLVAKGIQKGMFPDEKKVEAAAVYAATGSLQRTEQVTGVPMKQLRSWRATDEFKALLREVWEENNEKIDAKFTEIIEKSLDQVIDRVENGDFRLGKDGEPKRVPISAKDLSLVQAINVDKRQLLRGLPTSRSEAASAESDRTVGRLERLAETFEQLAKFGRKPKVIDVEDAILIENHAESTTEQVNGGGTDVPPSEGHPENKFRDEKNAELAKLHQELRRREKKRVRQEETGEGTA
jgi:hypothetical protein